MQNRIRLRLAMRETNIKYNHNLKLECDKQNNNKKVYRVRKILLFILLLPYRKNKYII